MSTFGLEEEEELLSHDEGSSSESDDDHSTSGSDEPSSEEDDDDEEEGGDRGGGGGEDRQGDGKEAGDGEEEDEEEAPDVFSPNDSPISANFTDDYKTKEKGRGSSMPRSASPIPKSLPTHRRTASPSSSTKSHTSIVLSDSSDKSDQSPRREEPATTGSSRETRRSKHKQRNPTDADSTEEVIDPIGKSTSVSLKPSPGKWVNPYHRRRNTAAHIPVRAPESRKNGRALIDLSGMGEGIQARRIQQKNYPHMQRKSRTIITPTKRSAMRSTLKQQMRNTRVGNKPKPTRTKSRPPPSSSSTSVNKKTRKKKNPPTSNAPRSTSKSKRSAGRKRSRSPKPAPRSTSKSKRSAGRKRSRSPKPKPKTTSRSSSQKPPSLLPTTRIPKKPKVVKPNRPPRSSSTAPNNKNKSTSANPSFSRKKRIRKKKKKKDKKKEKEDDEDEDDFSFFSPNRNYIPPSKSFTGKGLKNHYLDMKNYWLALREWRKKPSGVDYRIQQETNLWLHEEAYWAYLTPPLNFTWQSFHDYVLLSQQYYVEYVRHYLTRNGARDKAIIRDFFKRKEHVGTFNDLRAEWGIVKDRRGNWKFNKNFDDEWPKPFLGNIDLDKEPPTEEDAAFTSPPSKKALRAAKSSPYEPSTGSFRRAKINPTTMQDEGSSENEENKKEPSYMSPRGNKKFVLLHKDILPSMGVPTHFDPLNPPTPITPKDSSGKDNKKGKGKSSAKDSSPPKVPKKKDGLPIRQFNERKAWMANLLEEMRRMAEEIEKHPYGYRASVSEELTMPAMILWFSNNSTDLLKLPSSGSKIRALIKRNPIRGGDLWNKHFPFFGKLITRIFICMLLSLNIQLIRHAEWTKKRLDKEMGLAINIFDFWDCVEQVWIFAHKCICKTTIPYEEWKSYMWERIRPLAHKMYNRKESTPYVKYDFDVTDFVGALMSKVFNPSTPVFDYQLTEGQISEERMKVDNLIRPSLFLGAISRQHVLSLFEAGTSMEVIMPTIGYLFTSLEISQSTTRRLMDMCVSHFTDNKYLQEAKLNGTLYDTRNIHGYNKGFEHSGSDVAYDVETDNYFNWSSISGPSYCKVFEVLGDASMKCGFNQGYDTSSTYFATLVNSLSTTNLKERFRNWILMDSRRDPDWFTLLCCDDKGNLDILNRDGSFFDVLLYGVLRRSFGKVFEKWDASRSMKGRKLGLEPPDLWTYVERKWRDLYTRWVAMKAKEYKEGEEQLKEMFKRREIARKEKEKETIKNKFTAYSHRILDEKETSMEEYCLKKGYDLEKMKSGFEEYFPDDLNDEYEVELPEIQLEDALVPSKFKILFWDEPRIKKHVFAMIQGEAIDFEDDKDEEGDVRMAGTEEKKEEEGEPAKKDSYASANEVMTYIPLSILVATSLELCTDNMAGDINGPEQYAEKLHSDANEYVRCGTTILLEDYKKETALQKWALGISLVDKAKAIQMDGFFLTMNRLTELFDKEPHPEEGTAKWRVDDKGKKLRKLREHGATYGVWKPTNLHGVDPGKWNAAKEHNPINPMKALPPHLKGKRKWKALGKDPMPDLSALASQKLKKVEGIIPGKTIVGGNKTVFVDRTTVKFREQTELDFQTKAAQMLQSKNFRDICHRKAGLPLDFKWDLFSSPRHLELAMKRIMCKQRVEGLKSIAEWRLSKMNYYDKLKAAMDKELSKVKADDPSRQLLEANKQELVSKWSWLDDVGEVVRFYSEEMKGYEGLRTVATVFTWKVLQGMSEELASEQNATHLCKGKKQKYTNLQGNLAPYTSSCNSHFDKLLFLCYNTKYGFTTEDDEELKKAAKFGNKPENDTSLGYNWTSHRIPKYKGNRIGVPPAAGAPNFVDPRPQHSFMEPWKINYGKRDQYLKDHHSTPSGQWLCNMGLHTLGCIKLLQQSDMNTLGNGLQLNEFGIFSNITDAIPLIHSLGKGGLEKGDAYHIHNNPKKKKHPKGALPWKKHPKWLEKIYAFAYHSSRSPNYTKMWDKFLKNKDELSRDTSGPLSLVSTSAAGMDLGSGSKKKPPSPAKSRPGSHYAAGLYRSTQSNLIAHSDGFLEKSPWEGVIFDMIASKTNGDWGKYGSKGEVPRSQWYPRLKKEQIGSKYTVIKSPLVAKRKTTTSGPRLNIANNNIEKQRLEDVRKKKRRDAKNYHKKTKNQLLQFYSEQVRALIQSTDIHIAYENVAQVNQLLKSAIGVDIKEMRQLLHIVYEKNLCELELARVCLLIRFSACFKNLAIVSKDLPTKREGRRMHSIEKNAESFQFCFTPEVLRMSYDYITQFEELPQRHAYSSSVLAYTGNDESTAKDVKNCMKWMSSMALRKGERLKSLSNAGNTACEMALREIKTYFQQLAGYARGEKGKNEYKNKKWFWAKFKDVKDMPIPFIASLETASVSLYELQNSLMYDPGTTLWCYAQSQAHHNHPPRWRKCVLNIIYLVGRVGVAQKRKWEQLRARPNSLPPRFWMSESIFLCPEVVVWLSQCILGTKVIRNQLPALNLGDWETQEYVSEKLKSLIDILCTDLRLGNYPLTIPGNYQTIRYMSALYSLHIGKEAHYEGAPPNPQWVQLEYAMRYKSNPNQQLIWPPGYALKTDANANGKPKVLLLYNKDLMEKGWLDAFPFFDDYGLRTMRPSPERRQSISVPTVSPSSSTGKQKRRRSSSSSHSSKGKGKSNRKPRRNSSGNHNTQTTPAKKQSDDSVPKAAKKRVREDESSSPKAPTAKRQKPNTPPPQQEKPPTGTSEQTDEKVEVEEKEKEEKVREEEVDAPPVEEKEGTEEALEGSQGQKTPAVIIEGIKTPTSSPSPPEVPRATSVEGSEKSAEKRPFQAMIGKDEDVSLPPAKRPRLNDSLPTPVKEQTESMGIDDLETGVGMDVNEDEVDEFAARSDDDEALGKATSPVAPVRNSPPREGRNEQGIKYSKLPVPSSDEDDDDKENKPETDELVLHLDGSDEDEEDETADIPSILDENSPLEPIDEGENEDEESDDASDDDESRKGDEDEESEEEKSEDEKSEEEEEQVGGEEPMELDPDANPAEA